MREGGWLVSHSDRKHLHQGLQPAIHQFFEPECKGISDCEPCFSYLKFEEEGLD